MKIGWTACGLLWCLSVVASATRAGAGAGAGIVRSRPSSGSSRTQHRRLKERQAEVEDTAGAGAGAGAGVGAEVDQSAIDVELSGSTVVPSPSASAPVIGSSATIPSDSASSSAARITLPRPPTTPPTAPPRPAPSPMDLTVSYSLSNDCLLYISTFLTSSLFKSCLPFSLLLTTSTSYNQIVSESQKDSYATLNTLVGYMTSPQPSSSQCDDYFAGLTKSFGERKHCAVDIGEKGPTALDVRNGLGNYKVMREAAGLVDPDTGEYCYLQAVANERPDDMYHWSIPANIPTAKPTCSKCSGLLLNHYSASLSTPSALNTTIIRSASDTANAACGSTFVTYNNAALANSALRPLGFANIATGFAIIVLLAVLLLG